MGSLSLTSPTSEVVDGEKETEGAGAVVEKRAGGVVNFILVTDVAATLERVKEAGGEVERERWVEGGHTELGRYWDSEGNLGGVLKWLI
jgi:predicted enzyme related to lactoylglutathione lyase